MTTNAGWASHCSQFTTCFCAESSFITNALCHFLEGEPHALAWCPNSEIYCLSRGLIDFYVFQMNYDWCKNAQWSQTSWQLSGITFPVPSPASFLSKKRLFSASLTSYWYSYCNENDRKRNNVKDFAFHVAWRWSFVAIIEDDHILELMRLLYEFQLVLGVTGWWNSRNWVPSTLNQLEKSSIDWWRSGGLNPESTTIVTQRTPLNPFISSICSKRRIHKSHLSHSIDFRRGIISTGSGFSAGGAWGAPSTKQIKHIAKATNFHILLRIPNTKFTTKSQISGETQASCPNGSYCSGQSDTFNGLATKRSILFSNFCTKSLTVSSCFFYKRWYSSVAWAGGCWGSKVYFQARRRSFERGSERSLEEKGFLRCTTGKR